MSDDVSRLTHFQRIRVARVAWRLEACTCDAARRCPGADRHLALPYDLCAKVAAALSVAYPGVPVKEALKMHLGRHRLAARSLSGFYDHGGR